MAKVSIDDLDIAIQWLDLNEGADGEDEACKRVAEFLRAEIRRRETRAYEQQLARAVSEKVGRKITPAEIRKKNAGRQITGS